MLSKPSGICKRIFTTGGRLVQCLFFPQTGACICCGAEGVGAALCAQCAAGLRRAEQSAPGVFAYCAYEGTGRKLVVRMKYRNQPWLAKELARLMAVNMPARAYDLVCCVPLHKRRRRARGYDQAELLARALAGELHLPFAALLVRVRHTRAQANLDAEARAQNVRGAFAMRSGESVCGLRILLVDDVRTTGNTSQECVRVLSAAGAAEVDVAVLAQTARAGQDKPAHD